MTFKPEPFLILNSCITYFSSSVEFTLIIQTVSVSPNVNLCKTDRDLFYSDFLLLKNLVVILTLKLIFEKFSWIFFLEMKEELAENTDSCAQYI